MKRLITALCLVIVFFIVVSPVITARDILNEQKTVTITQGDYLALPFQLERADEITYSFEITNGSRINVFILPDDDYIDFQNGHRFNAYNPDMNVTMGNDTFWIPDDSRYYFVFDNSNRSDVNPWGSNNTTGNVTLSYSIETIIGPVFLMEDIIGWSVIILIVAISIIIAFYFRRKKSQNIGQTTTSEGIITDDIPILVRWRHMMTIERKLRQEWLSGYHKYLFYIGSLIAIFTGIGIIIFNENINLDFIQIFMLLSLSSLIIYYEALRLVNIEWKNNRFVSTIFVIMATFLVDLTISMGLGHQSASYSLIFETSLFITWFLAILRPLDLLRVKE